MSSARRTKRITSGVEILRRRYVKANHTKKQFIKDELDRLNIAQQIYDLRVAAGLTQADLAELAGTTASVISRLEDSNYMGHSLTMLRRIAAGLNKDIRIEFVESKGRAV